MKNVDDLLDRYLAGTLSGEELLLFDRQLAADPKLRQEADAYLSQLADRVPKLQEAPQPCVSQETLFAYVEGSLNPVDAEIIESLSETDPILKAHLEELRMNRVALQGLNNFAPTRLANFRRPFSLSVVRASMAAAAGLFLAIGMVTLFHGNRGAPLTHVAVAAERAQTLDRARIPTWIVAMAARAKLSPALGEDGSGLLHPVCTGIESDQPRFSWTPVPTAVLYRLDVRDDAERSVATQETSGANLALARGLVPGHEYVWSVTALAQDGSPLEVLNSNGSLRGVFSVLSGKDQLEIQRKRNQLPPNDVLAQAALDTAAGLLDKAAAELEQARPNILDPALSAAAVRLLSRIKRRFNQDTPEAGLPGYSKK